MVRSALNQLARRHTGHMCLKAHWTRTALTGDNSEICVADEVELPLQVTWAPKCYTRQPFLRCALALLMKIKTITIVFPICSVKVPSFVHSGSGELFLVFFNDAVAAVLPQLTPVITLLSPRACILPPLPGRDHARQPSRLDPTPN